MVSLDPISLETWQKQNLEYIRYIHYDIKPNEIVVDLGSYTGEFKNHIIKNFGCRVIDYDPLVNAAAWTYNGTISTGGAYYYTSMFEQGSDSYPCVDIAQELKPYDEIALLKINIEGAEYGVLSHLIKKDIIQRVKNIQVQFHRIEGEPYEKWYEQVVKDLTKTHKLTWQYKFCWENRERL